MLRAEKIMIGLFAFLKILDFHSTYIDTAKRGLFGEITEGNPIFWFFYDISLNWQFSLVIAVIITYLITICFVFSTRVFITRTERLIHRCFISSPYALVPINNYLYFLESGNFFFTRLVIALDFVVMFTSISFLVLIYLHHKNLI